MSKLNRYLLLILTDSNVASIYLYHDDSTNKAAVSDNRFINYLNLIISSFSNVAAIIFFINNIKISLL